MNDEVADVDDGPHGPAGEPCGAPGGPASGLFTGTSSIIGDADVDDEVADVDDGPCGGPGGERGGDLLLQGGGELSGGTGDGPGWEVLGDGGLAAAPQLRCNCAAAGPGDLLLQGGGELDDGCGGGPGWEVQGAGASAAAQQLLSLGWTPRCGAVICSGVAAAQ